MPRKDNSARYMVAHTAESENCKKIGLARSTDRRLENEWDDDDATNWEAQWWGGKEKWNETTMSPNQVWESHLTFDKSNYTIVQFSRSVWKSIRFSRQSHTSMRAVGAASDSQTESENYIKCQPVMQAKRRRKEPRKKSSERRRQRSTSWKKKDRKAKRRKKKKKFTQTFTLFTFDESYSILAFC